MNYTYIRATTSQVIVTAPGLVGAIIVNPDGSGDRARVMLYDGESVRDPRIIAVRTLAGETKVVRFQPPLKLQRGLYVFFSENVEEVVVQISWEAE